MYNLQQDIFVTNLVYEEKENYTLTSKQDELLPSDFTTKQKENLHKWCYKLGFEDGVTGFIEYIDENYLPNNKSYMDLINTNVSVRYALFKDRVKLNFIGGRNLPNSFKEVLDNLKYSWELICCSFQGFFSLPPYDYSLFSRTIVCRIKHCLKQNEYTRKDLTNVLSYLNNNEFLIVSKSPNEAKLLGKIKELYTNEFDKIETLKNQQLQKTLSSPEEFRVVFDSDSKANHVSLRIYKDGKAEFIKNGKKEIRDSIFDLEFVNSVFDIVSNNNYACLKKSDDIENSKEEFFNSFNLIEKPSKLNIGQKNYFFYLVRKFVTLLAALYGEKLATGYRDSLFKNIQPDNESYKEVYRREGYRFSDKGMLKTNNPVAYEYAKKIDEIFLNYENLYYQDSY